MGLDLYQIFNTHIRAWTTRELVFFLFFFAADLVVAIHKVRVKKIVPYQVVFFLLFLTYTAVVFASTVFTRNPGVRKYQLELFWSWKEILGIGTCGRLGSTSNEGLLLENILNMFLLFPAGFLIPFVWDKRFFWWQGLFIGSAISATIETLQLVLCRGLFEFDDIIHNSIGCMMGCLCGGYMLTKLCNWRK